MRSGKPRPRADVAFAQGDQGQVVRVQEYFDHAEALPAVGLGE
jgi:hypothetical protein